MSFHLNSLERKKGRCIVRGTNIASIFLYFWFAIDLFARNTRMGMLPSSQCNVTLWQVLLFQDKSTSLVHLVRLSSTSNQSLLLKFVKFHKRVIAVKTSNCQSGNKGVYIWCTAVPLESLIIKLEMSFSSFIYILSDDWGLSGCNVQCLTEKDVSHYTPGSNTTTV